MLDAEAGRLLGDGVLDGIGFERLERAGRRVALEAMGRALAARLNAGRGWRVRAGTSPATEATA